MPPPARCVRADLGRPWVSTIVRGRPGADIHVAGHGDASKKRAVAATQAVDPDPGMLLGGILSDAKRSTVSAPRRRKYSAALFASTSTTTRRRPCAAHHKSAATISRQCGVRSTSSRTRSPGGSRPRGVRGNRTYPPAPRSRRDNRSEQPRRTPPPWNLSRQPCVAWLPFTRFSKKSRKSCPRGTSLARAPSSPATTSALNELLRCRFNGRRNARSAATPGDEAAAAVIDDASAC
jgi:hypothetical protein